MPVRVVAMHHHAVRMPPSRAAEVQTFYENVLGMKADPNRPNLPIIPGAWMYIGDGGPAQIHLMGVADGLSPIAQDEKRDPARFHVALAVDDIVAARAELTRLEVPYWVLNETVPEKAQVFIEDPVGNMLELHQVGTCSCDMGTPGSPES